MLLQFAYLITCSLGCREGFSQSDDLDSCLGSRRPRWKSPFCPILQKDFKLAEYLGEYSNQQEFLVYPTFFYPPTETFQEFPLTQMFSQKKCSLLQTEPSFHALVPHQTCTAPAPWNSKYSLYLAFRDLIQGRKQMSRLRSLKSSAHYTFGLPNFHSSTNPLRTTETRFYFCLEDTTLPCSSSRLRPEIPCFPCSFPSSKMKK